MDPIRVGFIGAGSMANSVHYPSLASFKDVEIAAICDLDETRLNKTADQYGVEQRFKNYRLMLEKVPLDAVYAIMAPIPTDHYVNAEPLTSVVINCLKRGLHVFIEKPPGVSFEETRKMADTAEKYGCKTMVGFNRRFIPVFREAKRMVEENGPITHCIAVFHKNMIGQPEPWGRVSYLVADVIHAIDALRFMSGEAEEVTAYIYSFYVDYMNSFNALIRFKNGCVGHLCSNYSSGGRVHYFEMHSKALYAFVNLPFEPEKQEALILRSGRSYGEAEVLRNLELVEGCRDFHVVYGYLQENRHFIDCIRKDEIPETNFKDAIKTMKLVERINSSK
ncbi:Gfo/Idh/MocA family oxidoreductase [Candidatus Bathyarchaeota archaeon]|nr:Gfo/Idh/MocA family oxidoreductase [Candidatus Bathyarchaeota archaeon]MBS7617423.1 Gfo/Idh/MocA family oxidoreductase [Candidatus Bathyarchaeota archaeon]